MTVFVAQKCSRAQRNAIESTESPPTCTHTHICTGTHTCTLTYTQVHVNTCTHMYAYTHVYLHTCTHTDMYTYTHVHIHIHMCMRAPGAHPWIQTGAGRVWDKNKSPRPPSSFAFLIIFFLCFCQEDTIAAFQVFMQLIYLFFSGKHPCYTLRV